MKVKDQVADGQIYILSWNSGCLWPTPYLLCQICLLTSSSSYLISKNQKWWQEHWNRQLENQNLNIMFVSFVFSFFSLFKASTSLCKWISATVPKGRCKIKTKYPQYQQHMVFVNQHKLGTNPRGDVTCWSVALNRFSNLMKPKTL